MNIREIAQRCGVSTSTVSRILNNKPDVHPKTRQKVIDLMNELNFLPSVSTNSNKSIGIVTPSVLFPEFMGELMSGIMETAYSCNQTLTLIPISQTDCCNIMHYCRYNNLCGMIVINPPLSSKLPNALREHEIHHVILAAKLSDTAVSWVDVDNTGGARDAVQHLLHAGHRRIALFHMKVNDRCGKDRIQGYREALTGCGLAQDSSLEYEIQLPGADLTGPVSRMMQMENPPTAFFCTTHRETLKLLAAFKELDLAVPEQVSLAGFGDYEVSTLTKPPLTTVHQPIRDMGKAAVRLFQELLHMDRYEARNMLLPTRLIIRQSTSAL